ncbi:hypothetical protein BC834DRAFT_820950 [Gloeopeniophorella convolvens]|nr:hypothetical protein BC834DRAFT_820950 [Gloeopeniophorella convolvens]
MNGSQHGHTQSTGSRKSPDRTLVQVAPLTAPHPLLRALPSNTYLPTELIDLLDQTYFLHILANDPAKVLPPGKSLLSAMLKPHARERRDGEHPSLHDKVEEVIHIAFWEEALESLSSREPSVQLPRLKLLFNDLHDVLVPLFPADHPVLVSAVAPLSPTSSPLLSALNHFREILSALRERCAPARDAYIDDLVSSLADPPSEIPDLAKLAVETVRSLLKLAETMKDDLSQFVLGTMGEAELAAAIADQARTRERALTLDLWKETTIRESIPAWIGELSPLYSHIVVPPSRRWVIRLVQSLGATDPVACPLPTKPLAPEDDPPPSTPNALPPIFLFSTPELLYIQNFLQAIVIAAALHALLPPSAPPVEGFMSRIWALLLASVEEEQGAEDTRLVNLADELVQASALTSSEKVAALRASVTRTLRAQDPVFLLLQRRLLIALADRLAHTPTLTQRRDAPTEMRTGRQRQPYGATDKLKAVAEAVEVKGFGDSTLADAVREGMGKLQTVILWIDHTWKDLMDQGTS